MSEEKKSEEKFEYSYSAPTEEERREIEDIRRLYSPAPKAEGRLDTLRKLNRKVTLPPKVAAIVLGIVGVLIFGLGLTLVLEWNRLVWGIAVAAFGIAVLSVIYPVRRAILKRNKNKYGEQIVTLSDELLNGNESSKSD